MVGTIDDHEKLVNQTLRGAIPNVVDSPPTVGSPEGSGALTPSDDISRHQASRLRWYHKTHQLIGAKEQVMLTSDFEEKSIAHSSFNISINTDLKKKPNEAIQII